MIRPQWKARLLVFLVVGSLVSVARPVRSLELPEEAEAASASKREKVGKLLEMMNVREQSKQVMDFMIAALKPSVPDEFWAEFRAETDVQELVDLTAAIYEKHLTEQEIDDLLGFYSSPTGRSFIKKLPAILSESMAAGQEWGEQLQIRIREKQKAKSPAD